jgi:hypothetical protein
MPENFFEIYELFIWSGHIIKNLSHNQIYTQKNEPFSGSDKNI